MDSEITSGIKNVPFIPPSSPPPIDASVIQNDYDEFAEASDSEDMFDITGLSQKLHICEKNEKSTKVYPFNADNDRVGIGTETQQDNFDKSRLRGDLVPESKADVSVSDNDFLEGTIKGVDTVYEESNLFSNMSPPPLNCIALPTQDDSFLTSEHGFNGEVNAVNVSPENKQNSYEKEKLFMKNPQFHNDSDIPCMTLKDTSLDEAPKCGENNGTEYSHSTELENGKKVLLKSADVNSESISTVNTPSFSNRTDFQKGFVGKNLGSEVLKETQQTGIDDCVSGDKLSSERNDEDSDSENKISLTAVSDLKCQGENTSNFSASSDSETKVPSNVTHNTESEFADFKSTSQISATENSKSKESNTGNHEVSIYQIKPPPTDSDDDFGDFISNEHLNSKSQVASNELSEHDGTKHFVSVLPLRNNQEQIEDGNDDFGDFVANDNFTSNQKIEASYCPNQYSFNTPFPQIRNEAESDDEFGEFGNSTITLPQTKTKAESDDEFGEFRNSSIPLPQTKTETESDEEFGEFRNTSIPLPQTKTEAESDDEFGEFSNSSIPLPQIKTEIDSDEEFGEFGNSTIPLPQTKTEIDSDEEFGEFRNSSIPLPQIKTETESDDEFGEFRISSNLTPEEPFDADAIKTKNEIFINRNDNLNVSMVESEPQENSDDEFRNLSSSPSIAVTSDGKDYCGDKDGDGSSGLAALNNDDVEEEFGEFNCPETSTGLQLEFSDDDDDDFGSGHFLKADSKVALQGAFDENAAVDNQFRSLVLRWIPLTECSSPSEDTSNISIAKLTDVMEGDAFIWHHLEDIESSFALKLSWPSSHINKLFLSSLNVDARNILFGHKWSSTIPVFAQTLSFSPLTPAKPSTISKQWSIDENIVLDPSPPILLAESEKSTPLSTNEPKDIIEPKVIPPAQFDWSSSGLTNPLDASASFSSLFDYKVALPSSQGDLGKPRIDLSSLEEEILKNFSPAAASAAGSAVKPPRTSSTPILEKILRESGPIPTQNTELSSLPAEVRTIVQNLPDLSFMRSKVLMFPLREGF